MTNREIIENLKSKERITREYKKSKKDLFNLVKKTDELKKTWMLLKDVTEVFKNIALHLEEDDWCIFITPVSSNYLKTSEIYKADHIILLFNNGKQIKKENFDTLDEALLKGKNWIIEANTAN